jgi:hypothetical protein
MDCPCKSRGIAVWTPAVQTLHCNPRVSKLPASSFRAGRGVTRGLRDAYCTTLHKLFLFLLVLELLALRFALRVRTPTYGYRTEYTDAAVRRCFPLSRCRQPPWPSPLAPWPHYSLHIARMIARPLKKKRRFPQIAATAALRCRRTPEARQAHPPRGAQAPARRAP